MKIRCQPSLEGLNILTTPYGSKCNSSEKMWSVWGKGGKGKDIIANIRMLKVTKESYLNFPIKIFLP